jgi:hypothetical protein
LKYNEKWPLLFKTVRRGIYQNVIDLLMGLSFRGGPGAFLYVVLR